MKKSYLLLILFAFFSTIIFAQQDNYKWKVGLHSGGMGYLGDINTRLINPQTQWLADPMTNIRPAFGLSLEYAPGANFGLRALWSNGQFTANDRIVSFSNTLQTDAENFNRSLNARTNINDVSLIGTFYLQRSRPNKKRSISPYIMLGAGLTQFEVFGDLFLNNDSRYYYWSDFTVRDQPEGTAGEVLPVLQDGDYETNLTELQTENTDYATTVGNIPIGLGFKWRLGDKLSLNFETLWHYTFTDYLDDVSGVYPIDFDNPSALQSYASNPSSNQNIWRGREEDRFNDMYSFNSISLNYSFGYRKNTSPIDEIAYGNDTKTIKEITTIVVNEKGDTLKIEQKIREDDANETARLRDLDEAKKALEEEIAMLENQLEEAGETPETLIPEVEVEQPETPIVEVETPDEVVVAIDEPKLSRRERRRLEKEATEAVEIAIETPETPNAEITIEQPETPTLEVVIEPEITTPDAQPELPETPDAGDVVVEPEIEIVMEGERPARPARPDISLGDEEVTEVAIEIETPDTNVEIPDAEVEVEVTETRESRRERRRNRKDINKDIVIETPEEPSVEIVVGNNIEIELPEEVEVTQPETPTVEIEAETPETPIVEAEIEQPEVEIEVTQPEAPVVEVEVETPETPIVEVEVEQPEMPEVAIEVEAPDTPEVAIEEEAPKKLTRRDIRRMRRNPPDVNKAIEVESETATIPEEVLAEVREEPAEETPQVPAIEVETTDEVAIETPKEVEIEAPKPSQRPAGTPTREGALNPKISSPSAISFTTQDEARQAYEGFYVPFEDEAYYVSKELYTELDGIVRTMNRFPSMRVTLQGHTSEQEGISFVHQEITRKRVHYIQNYLVTKGVDLKRIQLSFFDDISNINEANKQQVDIRFR